MATYCDICDAEFEETLDHHRRKHQESAKITLNDGRTITLTPDAENVQYPWSCVICDKRYNAPGAVKKHIDSKHPDQEIPDDGVDLPQQAPQ